MILYFYTGLLKVQRKLKALKMNYLNWFSLNFEQTANEYDFKQEQIEWNLYNYTYICIQIYNHM